MPEQKKAKWSLEQGEEGGTREWASWEPREARLESPSLAGRAALGPLPGLTTSPPDSVRSVSNSPWDLWFCLLSPWAVPPPQEEVEAAVFPPVRSRGSSHAPICPLCSLRLCRYSTKLLSPLFARARMAVGAPFKVLGSQSSSHTTLQRLAVKGKNKD